MINDPYDDTNQHNIDNDIRFSCDFQYPVEIHESTLTEISASIQREVRQQVGEFLHRFLSVVLPSQNVRLQMVAFAYASGIDISYILNTENTLTSISKKLGVTKQSLSIAINTVSSQYGSVLKPNTGINPEAKQSYTDSNFRHSKT